MPYLSDKGIDSRLEEITSLGEFLNDKGLPNYKKQGQAIYNIVNWLRGGGRVYGMRVVAEDSSYANTILNIKTKPAAVPVYKKKADGVTYEKDANNARIPEFDADGVTPLTTAGVDIKLEMLRSDNMGINYNLKAQLESLNGVDADRYINHRIGAFVVKGRGEYGNKFSYRLSLKHFFRRHL